MADLSTIAEIADALLEPIPRIRYIASKLRIHPAKRAGLTGLYDDAQIQLIKQGLSEMRIQK